MSNKLWKSHNDENPHRSVELKKNELNENIFAQMNVSLNESHENLLFKRKNLQNYPSIFLFGLPRSGTTLLMQLFTLRFNVGYINNLIARFWRAPLYGIALSRELLHDSKHFSFESNYGKTSELSAPHEFSYFWHYWFNIDTLNGIDIDKIKQNTDWKRLTLLIQNMAHYFNSPIAFKGIWPAYAMTELQTAFPHAFFVYIKRDPEDVALSLYHARIAYYNTPNIWWSIYPPEYESLISQDWHEQIAGQVYFLTRFYESQLAQLPETSKAILHYEELCNAPYDAMDFLQEKLDDHTGYKMKITQDIPERFVVHHPDRNFAGADKLLDTVHRYFKYKDQK